MLRAVFFATLGALASSAQAQMWPSKPIRVIVTVAGGGETSARIVAEKLGSNLGVPVTVESQSGAGGAVAAQTVARAAPDGYTLLYANSGLSLRPFLVKDVPFDVQRDFVPIAQVGRATGAIVAAADAPFSSLAEVLEQARRNPGKVTYGTTGIGSAYHLAAVHVASVAGVELLHVPYKSTPQAITDLLAGRIHLALSASSSFVSLLQAGKLKLVATHDLRRMEQFPDVPTVTEVLPGYMPTPSWIGVLGPAALPGPLVQRLSGEIVRAAQSPEVKGKIEALGTLIHALPPPEFAAEIRRHSEISAKLVKAAGIRPE